MKLIDNEKRDIVKCIEAGRDLSDRLCPIKAGREVCYLNEPFLKILTSR